MNAPDAERSTAFGQFQDARISDAFSPAFRSGDSFASLRFVLPVLFRQPILRDVIRSFRPRGTAMNGNAMISCPQCHNSMAFDVSLAGRSVACPHCTYAFVMPGPAAAPAMATPVAAAAMPAYSSVAASRFRPSTSIWDVFDFKFEKYLTPWIIRVTWIAALIVTGLTISLYTFVLVASFVPKNSTPQTASSQEGSSASEPRSRLAIERLMPDGLSGDDRGDSNAQTILLNVFTWVSMTIAVLVSLLWIRVLLEMMIVLFNMATSLASIDRKIK